MSGLGRWAYTAKATIWRPVVDNRSGDISGWGKPVVIDCEYGGQVKKEFSSLGSEVVIKNTFWTEYAQAQKDDRIAIGEYSTPAPPDDADNVIFVQRYADTFSRKKDDWMIVTGG